MVPSWWRDDPTSKFCSGLGGWALLSLLLGTAELIPSPRSRLASAAGLVFPYYTSDLPRGPVDLVVDHDVIRQTASQPLFTLSNFEPADHAGVIVAATAEPGGLDLS